MKSEKRFLLPCSRAAICFYICVWVLAKLNCAIYAWLCLFCLFVFVCLFVCSFVRLLVCLFVCLFVCSFVCLFVWFIFCSFLFRLGFFFITPRYDLIFASEYVCVFLCMCDCFLDSIRFHCCSRSDHDQGRYNFQFGIGVDKVSCAAYLSHRKLVNTKAEHDGRS